MNYSIKFETDSSEELKLVVEFSDLRNIPDKYEFNIDRYGDCLKITDSESSMNLLLNVAEQNQRT